jgi:hypothetical protein
MAPSNVAARPSGVRRRTFWVVFHMGVIAMAARKNPLRAVTDADMPDKPPKMKSITEAAEDGDTLSELKAMRVLNAQMMSNPNIQGRDFAALSRRHLEIGREIDSLVLKAKQEAAEDGVTGTPDEEWDEEAI